MERANLHSAASYTQCKGKISASATVYNKGFKKNSWINNSCCFCIKVSCSRRTVSSSQVKSMSFVSWNTSVNWLSSPLQYIVPLHYLTMCNAVYIIVVRSIISYNYTSQVLYIWPQLCSYSKTVFISAIYTNIWASYSGFTRFCWSGYGSVTIKNLDSWYFFCEQNTTGDVARCAKQQVNFLATRSRFRRSWRRFFKQKRWKEIWWDDFIKLENL